MTRPLHLWWPLPPETPAALAAWRPESRYRRDKTCDDCGIIENFGWRTPSPFWDKVMQFHGTPDPGNLCVRCFGSRAVDVPFPQPVRFSLVPEFHWQTGR